MKRGVLYLLLISLEFCFLLFLIENLDWELGLYFLLRKGDFYEWVEFNCVFKDNKVILN